MTDVHHQLARALTEGNLAGFGPGSSMGDAERVLGPALFDTSYGKGESKLVTLSYGLIEAAFSNPGSWECCWIVVGLHRLATNPDSGKAIREKLGLRPERFRRWEDLRSQIEELDPAARPVRAGRVGEYEKWQVGGSAGRFVQVVADPAFERDDFPGYGDVWSLHFERV